MTGQDLAILSLLRRPFSSILVVLAIALAGLAAGRMARVSWLMEEQVKQLVTAPDMLIMSKGERLSQVLATSGMTPTQVTPFNAHVTPTLCDPKIGVKACVRVSPVASYKGYPLQGLGPDFGKAMKQLGMTLMEGQVPENNLQVVVGAAVPLKLSDSFSAILLPHKGFSKPVPANKDFMVRARLKPLGNALDRGIYFLEDGAWETYFWMITQGWLDMPIESHPVGYLWVYTRDTEKARRDLEELTNQSTVLSAIPIKDAVAQYQQLTASGRSLALMAGLLMALLASLGMGALLMSRAEHLLQQLAVLQALGKPFQFVASWMLTESFLLSSVGVLLASLLESLLPLSLGFPQSAGFLLTLNQPFFPMLGVIWSAMVGLGTLSVLPVLLRLKRMDVHEALRHI